MNLSSSPKLLTLNISSLFLLTILYHGLGTPVSTKGQTQFHGGIYLQDFMSIGFSCSCIISVLDHLQLHTLLCPRIVPIQKLYFDSRFHLHPPIKLTERVVSRRPLRAFSSQSLTYCPFRSECPWHHWDCFGWGLWWCSCCQIQWWLLRLYLAWHFKAVNTVGNFKN